MTSRRFHSFVIFAEMRTGSNFLESNLNAMPGVSCLGEAFNPYFIGGEGKHEMLGVDIVQRNADPGVLLKAMREKTRGIPGFRYFHDHDPRVFDLVMDDPGCAKIILTRNQLESYISWKIAVASDQWWLANTKHLKTVRPRFDLAEFEKRVDKLQAFQRVLLSRLQRAGQTAFYIDYDDILDLDVLNGLGTFLGVESPLKSLVLRFKKQNPEPIRDKVSNPREMEQGLARIDWFNQTHTPNFEPRRQGAVPQYLVSEGAPLLYLPIKAGPEAQMRQWLQSYGALIGDFDRQSLRKWKAAHPGQRSFTVLRHPVARAYAAYCDYLDREWMPELRPYLKRVHKFDLPPKGQGFATQDEHRAGFVVFLDLIKHLLAGRTELRTPAQFATQGATITGFAQVQSPDVLLREDRLEQGLAFLASETGIALNPLPAVPENHPFPLHTLYGPDIEAAAREAYGRDYTGFGFAAWQA